MNLWGRLILRTPRRAISSFVGRIARMPIPYPFNSLVYWTYSIVFGVNRAEIRRPLRSFRSFSDFFTREIDPDLRPIDKDGTGFASPIDGILGCTGAIEDGIAFQIKGRSYTISELLGEDPAPGAFDNDVFTHFYLRPGDYHRVHAPFDLSVNKIRYIPGDKFPVNPITLNQIDRVFCLNERVILFAESDGRRIVIALVGAMSVGRIILPFVGFVSGPGLRPMDVELEAPHKFRMGEELGLFDLGSMMVLLMPAGFRKITLESGTELKTGRSIH